jgi:hypothetical protein
MAITTKAVNEIIGIRKWMAANASRFVDACGEVNSTEMVEAWDREQSTGGATLDSNHPAWDVAVIVAEKHENA